MSPAFFRVVTRELRAAFGSPVAYIVIVIFLTVTGWFFFTPFFLNGRADLREFFRLLPMTLGLVVPAVTMRVFSEEFSTGSYEVLTTLPMTRFDVLLGKFTGSLLFILLMLVPTLAYPIIVASLGDLDAGPVVGGYVGAVLLAALYCSVGPVRLGADQEPDRGLHHRPGAVRLPGADRQGAVLHPRRPHRRAAVPGRRLPLPQRRQGGARLA